MKSYDDLFPSAEVRCSAPTSLIGRGAFHRSVPRPDPPILSRILTVSDNELAFATASPDLQPGYSSNDAVHVALMNRHGAIGAKYPLGVKGSF